MTMPSGRLAEYRYRDVVGRREDSASRVSQIDFDGTGVLLYEYLGLSTLVGVNYLAPDAKQERFGATSGVYSAYDRFDRVVEDEWTSYKNGASKKVYDVDLVLDRNGNVTVSDEDVHEGFDAEYSLDGFDRLTKASEGTWNGSAIISKTREREWTLDQVGNWSRAKLDLNGDGDFVDLGEYNDDRTYNEVNELIGRDLDDDGTDDLQLVYGSVGEVLDDDDEHEYVYVACA